MEDDLIRRIQVADPGAATPLYTSFASGIRVLLRHKLPDVDPELGLFHVLVAAARAVRLGRAHTREQLAAEIRASVNTFVHEAPVVSPDGERHWTKAIAQLLQEAEPFEREILKRFYLLAQTDAEIGRGLRMTPDSVVDVRDRFRLRYHSQDQP